MKDHEKHYEKLRKLLKETSNWPSIYLYKFFTPTDDRKIGQIEQIFDNMGAVITTKQSSKGNYTSVSIKVRMKDPDHVILKHKEVVANVEGVFYI